MTESESIIAKIKASEQRERDAKEALWQDEQKATDACTCLGCGRRWYMHPSRGRWVLANYLPEAGGVWHLACWARQKESR